MPKYLAKRNPKRCPSHPGPLIAGLLDELGLTVTHTAGALDLPRHRLAAIIAEKSPVTAEVALRLGKAFGDGAEVWLRMQVAHDLWRAARDVDLAEVVRLSGGSKQPTSWNDFFAEPGIDLPERDQPPQRRGRAGVAKKARKGGKTTPTRRGPGRAPKRV